MAERHRRQRAQIRQAVFEHDKTRRERFKERLVYLYWQIRAKLSDWASWFAFLAGYGD